MVVKSGLEFQNSNLSSIRVHPVHLWPFLLPGVYPPRRAVKFPASHLHLRWSCLVSRRSAFIPQSGPNSPQGHSPVCPEIARPAPFSMSFPSQLTMKSASRSCPLAPERAHRFSKKGTLPTPILNSATFNRSLSFCLLLTAYSLLPTCNLSHRHSRSIYS